MTRISCHAYLLPRLTKFALHKQPVQEDTFDYTKYLNGVYIPIFMRNNISTSEYASPIDLRIMRKQQRRCTIIYLLSRFTYYLYQHTCCIKFSILSGDVRKSCAHVIDWFLFITRVAFSRISSNKSINISLDIDRIFKDILFNVGRSDSLKFTKSIEEWSKTSSSSLICSITKKSGSCRQIKTSTSLFHLAAGAHRSQTTPWTLFYISKPIVLWIFSVCRWCLLY